MKKLLLITVILASVLLFGSLSAYADTEAKIIYLKGSVKVQEAGEDFWILAKKGMLLNDGDKIKTFTASEVEIAIDDTLKNIMRLEANTEVLIEDIRKGKFNMPKGEILALIEGLPDGSVFEVKTPTAVAGVAGSGMSVGTDGTSTTVGCFEDKAYVRGVTVDGKLMLEIVIIEEGYKRVVGRFEIPSDLLLLSIYDREKWSEFRANLRDHLDWLREKRAEGSRGAALALEQIQRMQDRFDDSRDNLFDEDEHDRRDGWGSGSSSSGDNDDDYIVAE